MAPNESGDGAAAAGGARSRCVLFICAANTARSVIAEHLLRRELGARGADGRVVGRSAGIAPYARDGALISLDTRMTLKEVGIDIGEDATSTDLKRHPELLEQADVVIAMTGAQARELAERFPSSSARPVFTLRSFAGGDGDIEDPFEQGHEKFDACREEIGRLIPPVADRLLEKSTAG